LFLKQVDFNGWFESFAISYARSGDDDDDDRWDELDLDQLDIDKLKKSRLVPLLPPIDHSTMQYAPFNKDFFEPHDEIASLDANKITDLRKSLGSFDCQT
jgi:hypothetical protein